MKIFSVKIALAVGLLAASAFPAKAELRNSVSCVWDWNDSAGNAAHAELRIAADYAFDYNSGTIVIGNGANVSVAVQNLSAAPSSASVTHGGINTPDGNLGDGGSFTFNSAGEIRVRFQYNPETTVNEEFVIHLYAAAAKFELRTADQGTYFCDGPIINHPDAFNTTLNVDVAAANAASPTSTTPRQGVEVRAWIRGNPYGDTQEKSPWQTTNLLGKTTVTLGAGSSPIAAAAFYYSPELYIRGEALQLDSDQPCDGYNAKTLILPTMKAFTGQLKVTLKDPDSHKLHGKVTVWGGKGMVPKTTSTDQSGETPDIPYPADDSVGQTKALKLTLFPKLTMSHHLTQNLDDTSVILETWPMYLSPQVTVSDEAYSCQQGLTAVKFQAREAASGTILVEVPPDHPLRRPSDLKPVARQRGHDRVYVPLDVTDPPADIKLRAVFVDTDEGAPDAEFVAGELAFYPPAPYELIKPEFHFEYVICRVGAWASVGKKFPIGRMFNPNVQLTLDEGIRTFFPAGLTTSLNPSFIPKAGGDAVFSFNSEHLEALCQELQDYWKDSKGAIDLVVGIVPPGSLHTHSLFSQGGAAGLSFGSCPNAVLIDPSLAKSHHGLHEFLHTLGLPDKDVADGDPQPPSANGFVHGGTYINVPEAPDYPQYQAVMYDHARVPFPDSGEYQTLIRYAAKSSYSSSGLKRTASTPSPTGKVVTLRGSITGTTAAPVVNLDPIFSGDGDIFDPQGDLDYGDYYARVVRQSGGSHVVYFKADYPFANPDGRVWNPDRLVSFYVQLPWYDDLASIQIGPSNIYGQLLAIWKELTPSAQPPVVTLTGPAGTNLSGTASITWQMSDADYNYLNAMLLISDDNGSTWRSVINNIPHNWSGNYAYSIDCADYPRGSTYKFRVLGTDGFDTAEAISGQTFTIDGYDPDPAIDLTRPAIEAVVARNTLAAHLALPIRNTGRSTLNVSIDRQALPPWLRYDQPENPLTLLPGAERMLVLSADRPGSETLIHNLVLNTNDPNHASVMVPLQLTSVAAPPTPETAWLTVDPPQDADAPWANDTPIRFEAYEATGGQSVQARITIARLTPYHVVVRDQLMDPGQFAGIFQYLWQPDGQVPAGRYGVEITMVDPQTGLADHNGSVAEDWDCLLYLKEPNSLPVFNNPSGETVTIQGRVGEELTIDYDVSDPDGDPVEVALHNQLVPMNWDKAARRIRWTPSDPINTSIYLTAMDPHLAMRTVEIKLAIGEPVNPALPRPLGSDLRDGKVFADGQTAANITVMCYAEGQQGCRLEYRSAGTGAWTIGPTVPYDVIDLGYAKYWMTQLTLPLTDFSPGAEIEVRLVNIAVGGLPDPTPPVYHVFTYSLAGELTAIEAPSQVEAGDTFSIRVGFINRSPYTWTTGTDVKLRPVGGGDPFTIKIEMQVPGWIQVPRNGAGQFVIDATAPAVSGTYLTRWELMVGGQLMPGMIEQSIQVIPKPVAPEDVLDYLLGRILPGAAWKVRADLNADSKIDIADYVQRVKP